MAESITVEIFTKKDSSLGDEAKAILDKVLHEFSVQLKVTNIENNPNLMARYPEKIPMVTLNGEESFVYKAHEITLRKKIEKILSGINAS